MKRWWLAFALLLSVGFNLGLLAGMAGGWWATGEASVEAEPPPRDGRHSHEGRRFRDHEGPGGERQGPPLDRLADHLGLDGETRSRFIELQRRLFEVQVESRRQRDRLGRDMRRELLAAEPDHGRIDSLIEQMGQTYVEAEKATAETILETRRLLTPRQQRQYLHVLERLRGGGEGDGPRGRHGGSGQRRRPPGS